MSPEIITKTNPNHEAFSTESDIRLESVGKTTEIISTSEEKIDAFNYDRSEVIENPDYVGVNFDSSLIVDGRVDMSDEKIRNKENPTQDAIDEARKENLLKVEAFKKYVDDFEDQLQHSRINPFGPNSPISPTQAVERSADGSFLVNISPTFLEQSKYLMQHCGEVVIVVPFYDDKRSDIEKRSDTPQTQQEIDEYTAICNQLIDELGDDITIELGNETNVSHDTGEVFGGDARKQFASYVDPAEYAKFYFEVASRIKDEHPEVKLSTAGEACFDEHYLEKVLSTIDEIKNENHVDISLVDIISYHPYGDNPENGAATINNGKFMETKLTFNEQLESMQLLASQYGVNLSIGEINFPRDDPDKKDKLSQSLSNIASKKVKAMIWPSATMPKKSI